MAATVGSINVALTSDLSGLTAGFQKGEKAISAYQATTTRAVGQIDARLATMGRSPLSAYASFVKSQGAVIGRYIDGMKAQFTALGSVGSAGILGAIGVGAVVSKAREAIGKLADLSDAADRAGVSGETLQIIGYALEKTTGSAEQATGALAKFNTVLGQAQVNDQSEQAAAFRRLGVAIEDASGRARGTEDVLNDVLKSLASIPSSAQRAAAAAALFGKAVGADMAAMLADGGRALADARQNGVQYTNAMLAQADDLDNALKDLGRTWDSVWKTAVIDVGGSVNTQVAKMKELSGALDDLAANPNWQTLGRFLFGGTDPHGADKLLKSVNSYIAAIPDRTGAPTGGALYAGAGANDLRATALKRVGTDAAADRIKATITALQFQSDQLGRTARQQAIYNALSQAGVDINSASGGAIAAAAGKLFDQEAAIDRINDRLALMRDTAHDALSTFIGDLRQGKSGAEALTDALSNVADKLTELALNKALEGIFGGGGIGGVRAGFGVNGGFFGFVGDLVGSLFGGGGGLSLGSLYASGGPVRGPGTGTSDSIVARVSAGEYIVNASAASRHRRLLDSINNGNLPAFAAGGAVSNWLNWSDARTLAPTGLGDSVAILRGDE